MLGTKIFSKKNIYQLFIHNTVPLFFIFICLIAIPYSGFSYGYLIQELMTRLIRNSFLVLALIIPIMAGMGLNFGMVLGAMAGQVGLIFVTDWNIVGMPGIFLAMIISTPLAIFVGWICGLILNKAKGKEMVTGFVLAFFAHGIYQLIVLYTMGYLIPIKRTALILSRGYGVRNTVNLIGIRTSLDDALSFQLGVLPIPVVTLLIIGLLCLFIVWFRKTKLGQDMRAIGNDMHVAESAGIPIWGTRTISIIISTVLASYGQIIYLQNIGTLNTYNSHEQIGMFSIAALLVGGATVAEASIKNVFIGVILFHLMFIVSPMAGKNLIGSPMLGEYFRVFATYGVIAVALVMHAWTRQKTKELQRRSFRGSSEG